jgi:hypothetical protein
MDGHKYIRGIGSEDEYCVFLLNVDFKLKDYMTSYPEYRTLTAPSEENLKIYRNE